MANMYIIWDKLYIIDLLVREKWIRYRVINQIVPVTLQYHIYTKYGLLLDQKYIFHNMKQYTKWIN